MEKTATQPTQIAKDVHTVFTGSPDGQRVLAHLRQKYVENVVPLGSHEAEIREWMGARNLVMWITQMIRHASEGRK